MKTRSWISISLLATGLLMISCTTGKPESKKTKPNIIIVYADDLGWADVGFNGNGVYETPHLDQMAKEGIILDRFYPSAANCAPSRATMLTGTYSPRHGVYIPQGLARGGELSEMRFKVPTQDADSTYNTFPVSINQVAPEFISLSELLSEAGYRTARFGKWHIGDDNQGFHQSSANGVPGEITNRGGKEKRYYSDTLVAQKLTDASIDFIQNNKDQPFFLYLAHWEVHGPNAARKERIEYYTDKFKQEGLENMNPVYAAEVEQLDLSLGRINATLKELDLEENTILIFASDNGGVSRHTSNLPLRAGKGTFYEGGIRTPCCIKWKGSIEPGTSTDLPVNGVDFMPTFAEIASAELPEKQAVDGTSILPLLKGDSFNADRSMFFHFPLYIGSGGEDKVLPSYTGKENYWRAVPLTVVIKGDWKLIYYYEYENFELYNLKEDISESQDLSSSHSDKARELLVELRTWTKEVNAPIPVVENLQ